MDYLNSNKLFYHDQDNFTRSASSGHDISQVLTVMIYPNSIRRIILSMNYRLLEAADYEMQLKFSNLQHCNNYLLM